MAGTNRRVATKPKKRRKTSGRKPRWLLTTTDLDAISQRRCLMILSVLSGEKSVEEASTEAQIAPAMYYQLEKKALSAMLVALMPGASTDGSPGPHVRQLEEKVAHLETLRRRSERLLFLTRQVLKPDPTKKRKRGRPRKVPDSTPSGSKPSRVYRKRKKTSASSTSTPTPDGGTKP